MALPIVAAAVAPLAGKLIDGLLSFFPDSRAAKDAEMKITATLLDYAAQQDANQAAVNKVEAAHASIFVAGWRPAIMWVCALCILYSFILYPWMIAIATVKFPELADKIPPPPNEELWALVVGVLGIGGLRTFEKNKGVSKGGG